MANSGVAPGASGTSFSASPDLKNSAPLKSVAYRITSSVMPSPGARRKPAQHHRPAGLATQQELGVDPTAGTDEAGGKDPLPPATSSNGFRSVSFSGRFNLGFEPSI